MKRIAALLGALLVAGALVVPVAQAANSTADFVYDAGYGAPVDRACATSNWSVVLFRDVDSAGNPNPPKVKICSNTPNLRVVPLWKMTLGETCVQNGGNYECVGFAGDTWRNANDNISGVRITRWNMPPGCSRVLRLYVDKDYVGGGLGPAMSGLNDWSLVNYIIHDRASSIRNECR